MMMLIELSERGKRSLLEGQKTYYKQGRVNDDA